MKKNIIKCSIIFLTILFICNFIYAATNTEYGGPSGTLDITEATIDNNMVLDYIGQFIFAIGNIFQSVTSWVFGILTGENVFPWADKIVFNTIPLLDVNFINPDQKSLFSLTNEIGIGEVIRNIYFTALSISIGFLGIIVGIMAIKMAISTIASEKARYKESIVKWLTSMVLLFGVHYLISFIFYTNEELVYTASKILANTIDTSNEEITEVINKDLDSRMQKVVDNFIEKAGGDKLGSENVSTLKGNYEVSYILLQDSNIRDNFLNMVDGNDKSAWYEKMAIKVGQFIPIDSLSPERAQGKLFARLVSDIASAKKEYEYLKQNGDEYSEQAILNNVNVCTELLNKYKQEYGEDSIQYIYEEYMLKSYEGQMNARTTGGNIISELGEVFKKLAWSIDLDEGEWTATSVSIISAILYTIFVFQSLGFFISYLKRVFMVVVLAILAPLVVIYDFFTKTAINSKNDIFSSWLKELCTLIFVQTFHAFLLAIIMSIIVKTISSSYISTITGEGGIQAVGLLAVFALISLPKLELLVKNIFGLTSGVADTSLAAGQRSSFAGSMLAFRAGKRLLDNPRKILGGAGRVVKGHFQVRKAKNARNDYFMANRDSLPATADEKGVNNGDKEKNVSVGKNGGSGTKRMSSISDLKDAIVGLTNELSRQSLNADKNNKGDKLAELNKAIEDARKEKNEGYKSMAAGLSETIGAVHGGIAGAVIGAGTNKDIGETALKGAGVGDYVGEAAFNGIQSTYGLGKEIGSGLKAEARAHTGKTRKAYKQVEKELKEMDEVTNKNMDDKIKNLSEIYDSTKKNMRKSTIKTKPTSNRNTKNSKYDAGNL